MARRSGVGRDNKVSSSHRVFSNTSSFFSTPPESVAVLGLPNIPNNHAVRIATGFFAMVTDCHSLGAARVREKLPTVGRLLEHAPIFFKPFLDHDPLANDWCERSNARMRQEVKSEGK